MSRLSDAVAVVEAQRGDPGVYAAVQARVGGLLIRDAWWGQRRWGWHRTFSLFSAGLMVLIALGFVLAGGIRLHRVEMATATAAGLLIQVQPGVDSHGHPDCNAVAAYQVAGRSYTARGLTSSGGFCQISPQTRVTVRYNPADPASGYIALGTEAFSQEFAIGAGIVILLAGVGFGAGRARALRTGMRMRAQGRAALSQHPLDREELATAARAEADVQEILRPQRSRNPIVGLGSRLTGTRRPSRFPSVADKPITHQGATYYGGIELNGAPLPPTHEH